MTKIRIGAVAAIVGLLGVLGMAAAPTAQARTLSVCITIESLGLAPICIQI